MADKRRKKIELRTQQFNIFFKHFMLIFCIKLSIKNFLFLIWSDSVTKSFVCKVQFYVITIIKTLC